MQAKVFMAFLLAVSALGCCFAGQVEDDEFSFFDTFYIEPTNSLTNSTRLLQEHINLGTFIKNQLQPRQFPFHVSIGLIGHNAAVDCCAINDNSPLMAFFKTIGSGYPELRVTLHVVDGFAGKWPFSYAGISGLDAVAKYYADLQKELYLKGYIQLSGLVFGESMGGSPMQGTEQCVDMVRQAVTKATGNPQEIFVGESPGGLTSLNEWYPQIYFWHQEATNLWVTHRDNPVLLFAGIQADPASYDECKPNSNNWVDSNGTWRFLLPQTEPRRVWMFAWDVPGQSRLMGWSYDGLQSFARFVKSGQQPKAKLALYFGFSDPDQEAAVLARDELFSQLAALPPFTPGGGGGGGGNDPDNPDNPVNPITHAYYAQQFRELFGPIGTRHGNYVRTGEDEFTNTVSGTKYSSLDFGESDYAEILGKLWPY